jgi:hypothetical protein
MIGALVAGAIGLSIGPASLVEAGHLKCPPDSVESGTLCVDKCEASVWHLLGLSSAARNQLVKQIQQGTVTLADLLGAGATQVGLAPGDLTAAGCPAMGSGCVHVYAVSIPGVMPARFITWFQAGAAARNADKRLPTNAEWQVAALGTPDTGGADDEATTCNTDGDAPAEGPTPTGSRAGCVSDVGAFDMAGNLWEWVADWARRSFGCGGSWVGFSDGTSDRSRAGDAAKPPRRERFRRAGTREQGLAGEPPVLAVGQPSSDGLPPVADPGPAGRPV